MGASYEIQLGFWEEIRKRLYNNFKVFMRGFRHQFGTRISGWFFWKILWDLRGSAGGVHPCGNIQYQVNYGLNISSWITLTGQLLFFIARAVRDTVVLPRWQKLKMFAFAIWISLGNGSDWPRNAFIGRNVSSFSSHRCYVSKCVNIWRVYWVLVAQSA